MVEPKQLAQYIGFELYKAKDILFYFCKEKSK